MKYWFENHSNTVGGGLQSVYLLSSYSKDKHGVVCMPTNFRRSLSMYIARVLIKSSFDIIDNVYITPSKEGHE
jgi:hypothetical protein